MTGITEGVCSWWGCRGCACINGSALCFAKMIHFWEISVEKLSILVRTMKELEKEGENIARCEVQNEMMTLQVLCDIHWYTSAENEKTNKKNNEELAVAKESQGGSRLKLISFTQLCRHLTEAGSSCCQDEVNGPLIR